MNDKPHTHNLKFGRRYHTAGGCLQVTYGDTTIPVKRWWQTMTTTNHPSEKLIRKVVRKAIRQHDQGSIRAGNRAGNQLDEVLNRVLGEFTNLPSDEWASTARAAGSRATAVGRTAGG